MAMRDLRNRLNGHIMQMAPHQRERDGGMLLIACRDVVDAQAAEIERLTQMIDDMQGKHWPATPGQVRALLGSRCAAVRYALEVPTGEFEAPPHEDDTYTASAHDIITANWSAMDQRQIDAEEIERLRAALAEVGHGTSATGVLTP
jgi:hypothetical protein